MYLTSIILSSILANICWIYLGKIITNSKVKIISLKIVLLILGGSFMLTLINIYFVSFFKVFMNYLLVGIIYKILFKEDMDNIFLLSIIIFIYYFISEIIFSIPLTLYLYLFDISIKANNFLSIIINIAITVIIVILINIKIVKRLTYSVYMKASKYQLQKIIIVIIFAIAIFSRKNTDLLGVNTGYAMNLILIVIFAVIVYFLYKEKESSFRISEKHDQLLNYIKRYEKEITSKSTTIHSFKNQLIAIKGFVKKDDIDLTNYINSIMQELNEIEHTNLRDMEYLPVGGLKGLIYYKFGDLNGDKVKINISVDKKIKKSIFYKTNQKLYNDILKIIGIYLDNAIEAVNNAPNKELLLELRHNKNEDHFILSNTYEGKINAEKIDNIGYSTKGKKRGYGLYLAKKIIDNCNNLYQYRDISETIYTVHLVVKQKD